MSQEVWYSVAVMLPKVGSDVFVQTRDGEYFSAFYGEYGWGIPLEKWTIGSPVVVLWRYERA